MYPWSPLEDFSIRGDDLCSGLSVEDVTEADLEICEVKCEPTKVKECAKVRPCFSYVTAMIFRSVLSSMFVLVFWIQVVSVTLIPSTLLCY